MMRVLMISPLPPYYYGGVEKVVGETIKNLIKKGCEVQLLCGTLGMSRQTTWNGISVKEYHTRKLVGYGSIRMLIDIYKNSGSFDVAHAHGSSTTVPLIAAIGCTKSPLVFSPHFHPEGSSSVFKILKRVYDLIFTRYVLRKAKKIICVSEVEKKLITDMFHMPDDKLVVIPNGVDASSISLAEPYQFNGKLILYVGRLEKYKNIHRIVEAMKYLPENFYFYIIGNGPYREKLEKMISKHSLKNRVRIFTSCSEEEVYRWMKTSSLFMNLSDVEAFGITVIEALAAEKPVIVNDRLGLSEIASVFKNQIVPIMADEVSDEELAEVIKDSIARQIKLPSLEAYSWDKISDRLLKCYTTLSTGAKME